MTRESDIMHEAGSYFVLRVRGAYTVCKNGHVHATADSSYPLTDDGLAIAKARADYLARREVNAP